MLKSTNLAKGYHILLQTSRKLSGGSSNYFLTSIKLWQDMILIYCNWVSTQWQLSVDLYRNRKERAQKEKQCNLLAVLYVWSQGRRGGGWLVIVWYWLCWCLLPHILAIMACHCCCIRARYCTMWHTQHHTINLELINVSGLFAEEYASETNAICTWSVTVNP